MFTITKRRMSPIESNFKSPLSKITTFEDLINDFNFTNNDVKSNIINQDNFQEIQMCVPGVDKKLIKISIDGFILNVKYQMDDSDSEDLKKYSLRGFYKTSFDKNFRLSKDSKLESITSKCTNGILYIKIPKNDSIENKKINIDVK